jgi:uncharacterized protein (DUF433 family)
LNNGGSNVEVQSMKQQKLKTHRLIREELPDGTVYEYIRLGKHVVSAPGVCRGRPTFKYTRIEVAGVLEWISAGNTVEELLKGYRGRITQEAIKEAAALAGKALTRQSRAKLSFP